MARPKFSEGNPPAKNPWRGKERTRCGQEWSAQAMNSARDHNKPTTRFSGAFSCGKEANLLCRRHFDETNEMT